MKKQCAKVLLVLRGLVVSKLKRGLDRTFIFDGAHNAAGAESFGMTYAELFKDTPKTIVMAILKDKNQEAIIREVVKAGDTVLVVPAPTDRTEVPEALVEVIRRTVPKATAQTADSVEDALAWPISILRLAILLPYAVRYIF